MFSLLHIAVFTWRPAKFSQFGLAVKLMTLLGQEAGAVKGSQQRLFEGVGTSPLKHVFDPCDASRTKQYHRVTLGSNADNHLSSA